MPDPRYVVEITFTVHPFTEHLENEVAIRAEVRSWLEGLRATVHAVRVRETTDASAPEAC